MKKIVLLFVLCMSTLLLAAGKPKMEDVAGKLACYCGTCPHLVVTACGCSTADQIKADIQKMIDGGQSEKQILDSYIAQYGQTVLAAPTKSGFNLTAWAIPFVAFIAGGFFLISYLRKQRAAASSFEPEKDSSNLSDEQDEHYRKMLREEIEQRK